ncbi:hypothetical protein V6Z11_1Z098400 [Gossypium hirsutum]
MERKQGFFSVVRGLSPSRSRLLRRRRNNVSHHVSQPDPLIFRSGSLRPAEALSPLKEGPDPDGTDAGESRMEGRWAQWMKGQLARAPSVSTSTCKRSDLRLLLGVLGAPLAPVHVSALDPFPLLSIKDTPIETSSAQYILQQYTAASGWRMIASEFETANKVTKNRNSSKAAESGGFVLWQMNPDMWYVELALGGSKVHAGCNGKLVWRHTPWLGAHAAKGPVRPLRRALQDCFILKLCADPATLKARSEGPAEIIRHVLFGYFSQKTGLLVHMEDSHLTRIQNNGGDAILQMSHTRTRMEEAWAIEEVAFNVPGLSMVCFIPPAEIRLAHQ